MQNSLNKMLARMFADKKRQRRIVAVICVLSLLVTTSVFTELMQPVITMTPDLICGQDEHTHGSDCFTNQLACGVEDQEEHVHTDECYKSVLTCGMSEHAHTDKCYPEKVEEPKVSLIEHTAVPTEEPTAEPTAEPTVEATAEPTAEPTVEPTVEATVEPTAEPTAEPVVEVVAPVVAITDISAEMVFVGQTVTWTIEASDGAELSYYIVDENGAEIVSGALDAGASCVSWQADRAGKFTLAVNAVNEAGSASANGSVTVEASADLAASVRADDPYCFAGDEISFQFAYSGGVEPAAVSIIVCQDDQVLAELDEFAETVTVTPADLGEKETTVTAEITVVDSLGSAVTDTCEIPCAVSVRETESDWEKSADVDLTGEWPEDLIAVAETQLGYEESDVNFIVNGDGERQGYTRYGHWYGSSYAEWCAMFVSFDLNYADIPESYFPREANCKKWVSALKDSGLYESAEDGYEPNAGDLLFLDCDNDGDSDHMGVITSVSGNTIRTIEGNVEKSVRRCEYDLDDKKIVGYGCVLEAYEQYLRDELDLDLEAGVGAKAVIIVDTANLRAEADVNSEKIASLVNGTVVDVLASRQNRAEIWYQVAAGEQVGYVRSDLVEINYIVEDDPTPLPTEEDLIPMITEEPTPLPTEDELVPMPTEETTPLPTEEELAPMPTVESTPLPTEENLIPDVTYDSLMARVAALPFDGSEAHYIAAAAIAADADAAFAAGLLTSDEYAAIINALTAEYAVMPIDEAAPVAEGVSAAKAYKMSDNYYGWEISMVFVPVDASGNVLEDVAAPAPIRSKFLYTEWSSSKSVAANSADIKALLPNDTIYNIDFEYVADGTRAKDAEYLKINAGTPSGCTMKVGKTSATSHCSKTQIQSYYLAVYYIPTVCEIEFVDGETQVNAISCYPGATVDLSEVAAGYELNEANADGKYFTGWQDAAGNVYRFEIENVSSAMTLSAVWSDAPLDEHTITFIANGAQIGTAAALDSLKFAEVTAPDASREGYRFDGWFTEADGGEQYTASTVITAGVTLYAHYTEYIDVSFVIANSEYTNDSGYTHVAVASTEGLNTDDFTYELFGTGDRYHVFGTGMLVTFTIPAGESLSMNGLSTEIIDVVNPIVNDDTSSNTYSYVSSYSWLDDSKKVCNDNTIFNADTTLTLRLYASNEKYTFNYVCCKDCDHSIIYELSEAGVAITNPGIAMGESVDAAYIPSASDVSAYFSCDGTECSACGRSNGKVLDYWYMLDNNGNEVKFVGGTQLTTTIATSDGNSVKVYAKWKDAPNNVNVTFHDLGSSSTVEVPCYSTFGEIKPEIAEHEGCTFLGWSVDGGMNFISDSYIVSADAEFTAIYDVTITIQVPDLANDPASYIPYSTMTVRAGDTLSASQFTAPAFSNGYMLNNWVVEYADGSSETAEQWWSTTVNGAMTVKAQYVQAYTVTYRYHVDGMEEGQYAEIAKYYVKQGDIIFNAVDENGNSAGYLNVFEYSGYNFNGWLDENGNRYNPSSYDPLPGDLVLTADLTRTHYYIYYSYEVGTDISVDENGNETITPAYETISMKVPVGGKLSDAVAVDESGYTGIPVPEVLANDVAFVGWVTDCQDPDCEVATGDTVPTGDTSYMPRFRTVNVAFNIGGMTYTINGIKAGLTVDEAFAIAVEMGLTDVTEDAAFRGWADANGETVDSATVQVTEDAAFTAVYAEKVKVTFMHTYIDAETGLEVNNPVATCEVMPGDALSTALTELPVAKEDGKIFQCWNQMNADGTSTKIENLDFVVIPEADATEVVYHAVFTDAAKISFVYKDVMDSDHDGDTAEVITYAEYAMAQGEMLSTATRTVVINGVETVETLSEIPAPTFENYIFSGWYYPTEDGNAGMLTSLDLIANEDTIFTGIFEEIADHTVTLHDIDPDGNERLPVGVDSLTVKVPDGQSVANYLRGVEMVERSAAEVIKWRVKDAEGAMVEYDPTQPVTGDLDLYTYTYRIVLTLGEETTEEETASLLDLLMPKAYAATVEIKDGQLVVEFSDGEKLSHADFVKDGVDYTLYSWNFTNVPEGSGINSIDSLINYANNSMQPGDVIEASGTAPNYTTKRRTVTFKAYVDGEWKVIETRDMTFYVAGQTMNYYSLSAAQMESVYGKLGFEASNMPLVNGYSPFAYFDRYYGGSYLFGGVHYGDGLVRASYFTYDYDNYYDSYASEVYYLPGDPLTTTWTNANNAPYAEFVTPGNSFYTVTVLGEEDKGPISYISANGSVTLMPRNGNVWMLAEGYENSCTLADDGLTITNATSPIVVEPAGEVTYSIKVVDADNIVYTAAECADFTQTVMPGEPASITLSTVQKQPVEGVTITWKVYNVNGTEETTGFTQIKDETAGTITFTFDSVNHSYVLKPEVTIPEGVYKVSYDVNTTGASFSDYSPQPGFNGKNTFSELANTNVAEGETFSYLVKSPSPTYYFSENGKYLTYHWITGWAVNGNTNNVIPIGTVLTAEQLAQYADADGQITLTAIWDDVYNPGSWSATPVVDFYVALDCSTQDMNDDAVNVPTENFTSSVFSALVIDKDGNVIPAVSNASVLHYGSNDVSTKAIDTTLRNMVTTPITSNGTDYYLTGFPNDEYVFAQIRDLQKGWITAFESAKANNSSLTPKAYTSKDGAYKGKLIYIGDNYVPVEDLTSENFEIRWNVFKDTDDGYHIDGLLMQKIARVTIVKTFAGDQDAINAVKERYSITVDNQTGSEDTMSLLLQSEDTVRDTKSIGYTSVSDDGNTYTWVITGTRNHVYKVLENNYIVHEYDGFDTYNSSATYAITNSSEATGGYRVYTDNGVIVTAYSYPEDYEYKSYQTLTMRNVYTKADTLTIRKIDSVTNEGIGGVSYTLKDSNGNPVGLYRNDDGLYSTDSGDQEHGYTSATEMITDDHGYILVKLGEGSFILEETEPTGYQEAQKLLVNVVVNDGVVQFGEVKAFDENVQLESGLVDAQTATLTIKNVSRTTSVTAKKIWADGTNLPVVVQLVRNGVPMQGDAYTVTLDAPTWSYTWDDLPLFTDGTAAIYTLQEKKIGDTNASTTADTDGFADYSVSYSTSMIYYKNGTRVPAAVWQEDGVTHYADNAEISVTNITDYGNLTFYKTDDMGAFLEGATFTLYSEDKPIANATSNANGVVTFPALAPGSYLLMKETGTPAGYRNNDTSYEVVVTGVSTLIYELDADGERVQVNGVETPITTIKNYPSSASIKLAKVDEKGKGLSGATFQIKKDGVPYLIGNTNSSTFSPNTVIELADLPAGNYTITETKAPNGYYGMTDTISFTITDGEVTVNGDLPGGVTFTGDGSDTAMYTFTVTNTPGVELPSTGGAGTLPYMIGGLLLMAASLLYGIGQRRKGERGDTD